MTTFLPMRGESGLRSTLSRRASACMSFSSCSSLPFSMRGMTVWSCSSVPTMPRMSPGKIRMDDDGTYIICEPRCMLMMLMP